MRKVRTPLGAWGRDLDLPRCQGDGAGVRGTGCFGGRLITALKITHGGFGVERFDTSGGDPNNRQNLGCKDFPFRKVEEQERKKAREIQYTQLKHSP